MGSTSSNYFELSVVDQTVQTVLEQTALNLQSGQFSADIPIIGLDTKHQRYVAPEFYDPNYIFNEGLGADPEWDYPTHGNNVKDWNWVSKALYDPISRKILHVTSPHIETTHPFATFLLVYEELTNEIRVYSNPCADRTVGHGFDNNGIAIGRRRLYKQCYYGTGTAAPFTTGEIIGIDIDAVTSNVTSAWEGGAVAEVIEKPPPSQRTAGGMDFMPNMGTQGSLLWFCGNDLHRYDLATGAWSEMSTTLNPTNPEESPTIHNVGHYNPVGDYFVCGGGGLGYDPLTTIRSNALWKVDPDGTITSLDDGPKYAMSVNNQIPSGKVCFVAHPTEAKDVCIFADNEIWILDPSAQGGSQWTNLNVTWPGDFLISDVNCAFACSLPHINCVIIFRYDDNGAASARLFKL